jgi:hypothetical protein
LSGVISANLWLSFISLALSAVHAVSHELSHTARACTGFVREAALRSELLASLFFFASLASNMPGCSRMAQARRSGPCGSARQFSANAGDENAADKPTNAKPILSVVITGLVSISVCPNAYPCAMN